MQQLTCARRGRVRFTLEARGAARRCAGAAPHGRAVRGAERELSVVLNWSSAVPDGAGAVHAAAAAGGSMKAAPHPHPLRAAGAELPGRAVDSLPGGRACCCEVGMWVALSSPPSLPSHAVLLL